MNLFGKKKSAPPPPKANPVDAINILRQQLEVLEKRERKKPYFGCDDVEPIQFELLTPNS